MASKLRKGAGKSLLGESPIPVFPTLARLLGGMERAALMQQLHYEQAEKGNGVYVSLDRDPDRHFWTELTYWDWAHRLCRAAISPKQAFNILRPLRDDVKDGLGVILARKYGARRGDQTLFWSIDYDRLDAIIADSEIGTADSETGRPHSRSGTADSETGISTDSETGISAREPAADSKDKSRTEDGQQDGLLTEVPDLGNLLPMDREMVRAILPILRGVERYPFDGKRDAEMILKLRTDFPKLNLIDEMKRWATWMLDHPLKGDRSESPRLRIRTWMGKARDGFRGRRHEQGGTGKDFEF